MCVLCVCVSCVAIPYHLDASLHPLGVLSKSSNYHFFSLCKSAVGTAALLVDFFYPTYSGACGANSAVISFIVRAAVLVTDSSSSSCAVKRVRVLG